MPSQTQAVDNSFISRAFKLTISNTRQEERTIVTEKLKSVTRNLNKQEPNNKYV